MTAFKFKTNINCGNCVKTVTPFLNELDEIESWKVDTEHTDKILQVEIERDGPEEIIEAIKKAGFIIEKI